MVKFYEGRTTEAVEKIRHKSLKLPHLSFCMERPFKKRALENMGLRERFFLTAEPAYTNMSLDFPRLNKTWQKATYSDKEVDISWRLYSGMKIGFK